MTHPRTDPDGRVLVAYETRHGATPEIAEAIAAELIANGVGAECRAADDVPDLEPYRAVVLGTAPAPGGGEGLLSGHQDRLRGKALWLFADAPDREEDAAGALAVADGLDVRGRTVFSRRPPAGSVLAQEQHDGLPLHQRGARDWRPVHAWAVAVARELKAAPMSA